MEPNLDELIICRRCETLQKRVELPKKKVAKCIECNEVLYRNIEDSFNKGLAFSITSLILFIIANSFPIITVLITGQINALTIPSMIYSLYNEDFFVVGSIVLVVLVIAPLSVMLSYIIVGVFIKLKIFKSLTRHLIAFLVISKSWEMIDIFTVSILVALVKLFGYAEIHFGLSAVALVLFVIVDIFVLKNIKPVELWTYYSREYCG